MRNQINPSRHFYLRVAVIVERIRAIAGFPEHPGIDNSHLVMEGEVQIRSGQDCDRGLWGGELAGNTTRGAGVLMLIQGMAEETDTVPDSSVNSGGRSGLRISVIDPWKFKIELMQQSGNTDEPGIALPVHIGQHPCIVLWLGMQSILSPESCTRKTVSRI